MFYIFFIFYWQSFRPNNCSAVDSASNRNEYQEYFLGDKGGRCVGLTTLPPSCADCPEIREPQPTGTLWACPDLYRYYFIITSRLLNPLQLICTDFTSYKFCSSPNIQFQIYALLFAFIQSTLLPLFGPLRDPVVTISQNFTVILSSVKFFL